MIMVYKNISRYDANASDEFDPSVLSCGQPVQMVIAFDNEWTNIWRRSIASDNLSPSITIQRDMSVRWWRRSIMGCSRR